MNEQIPHFSTISYNFKHRYIEETIEEIFYWILKEISNASYLSPEAVFIDGTHQGKYQYEKSGQKGSFASGKDI